MAHSMATTPKPSSRRKPGSTDPGVLVGRILGAHGVKGEVRLTSFTADPKAIAGYNPLETAQGRLIEIVKLRPNKDGFIAILKGIADRNAAEALKGVELFVPRAQLPGLEEDELYLADLVGKSVGHNGMILGTIARFQNFGAGDLMELDTGLLIPAAFITSAGKSVAVSLPEGYLDEGGKS